MQEYLSVLPEQASDLPLSDLRERYRKGELSRKEFEGGIYKFLLDNYRHFHVYDHDRDAFAEYLSWLYLRISRAIDAYKEVGASFDAYIASIVRWSSKEYRSRAVDHLVTECAYWEARTEEALAADECPPVYPLEPVLGRVKNPRHVLILLLKSYSFVSDESIIRVAPSLGIGEDKLRWMLEEIRNLRENQEEEIRELQEKLSRQYYRCVTYRRRLELLPETGSQRETVKGLLERAQARYGKTKRRLSSISREASNSQIAKVLGIPKGSVDSALYNMKQRAARGVYEPSDWYEPLDADGDIARGGAVSGRK